MDSLQKLIFKNYGIVRDTDRFAWKKIPCAYLESQNVTGPYVGWADTGMCNYLYQLIGNDLVHPPSGMRSSVPLGGKYIVYNNIIMYIIICSCKCTCVLC